jgi:hypothetical protein
MHLKTHPAEAYAPVEHQAITIYYVFVITTQFQKSRLNKLELKPSLNEHKKGFKDYNALN